MQEIKSNSFGIRITDTDLKRMEAIKEKMGVRSMTKTTLAYDLLMIGIRVMETRYGLDGGEDGVLFGELEGEKTKHSGARGEKKGGRHV